MAPLTRRLRAQAKGRVRRAGASQSLSTPGLTHRAREPHRRTTLACGLIEPRHRTPCARPLRVPSPCVAWPSTSMRSRQRGGSLPPSGRPSGPLPLCTARPACPSLPRQSRCAWRSGAWAAASARASARRHRSAARGGPDPGHRWDRSRRHPRCGAGADHARPAGPPQRGGCPRSGGPEARAGWRGHSSDPAEQDRSDRRWRSAVAVAGDLHASSALAETGPDRRWPSVSAGDQGWRGQCYGAGGGEVPRILKRLPGEPGWIRRPSPGTRRASAWRRTWSLAAPIWRPSYRRGDGGHRRCRPAMPSGYSPSAALWHQFQAGCLKRVISGARHGASSRTAA
jgi:hypothetical protein